MSSMRASTLTVMRWDCPLAAAATSSAARNGFIIWIGSGELDRPRYAMVCPTPLTLLDRSRACRPAFTANHAGTLPDDYQLAGSHFGNFLHRSVRPANLQAGSGRGAEPEMQPAIVDGK